MSPIVFLEDFVFFLHFCHVIHYYITLFHVTGPPQFLDLSFNFDNFGLHFPPRLKLFALFSFLIIANKFDQ